MINAVFKYSYFIKECTKILIVLIIIIFTTFSTLASVLFEIRYSYDCDMNVDITNMLIDYCKYNNYSESETNEMIAKNSKITMYNYKSNPILPDSDFDGKLDWEDKDKLNNEFKSTNETANFSNVKINFNQDYRYFFMDQKSYYEDVAEMGLILSNMATKKKGSSKPWSNKVAGTTKTLTGLYDYLYYIGMTDIEDHSNEQVPYALSHHDTIAQMGKVNNLERNIITLVIGEDEDYKNILAANYDGSLGIDGLFEGDYHHIGYDVEATKIYEKLIDYDNNQNPNWKKSFWIVGYGTGGSIANLVAKKLIDNKGNKGPVYCYTYQAPGTINRNNLDKQIYNEKYYSIFNIVNTDDVFLYFENEDFDKYGRDKKLAAGYTMDRKRVSNGLLYNTKIKLTDKILLAIESNKNVVNIQSNEISAFSLTDMILSAFDSSFDFLRTLYYSLLKISPLGDDVVSMAKDNNEVLEGSAASTIYNKYIYGISTAKDHKYVYNVIAKTGEIPNKSLITDKSSSNIGKTLNYLDELGVWYVNNVVSYQGSIKGKYNLGTTEAQNNFSEHATISADNEAYIINDDSLYQIKDNSGTITRLLYKYDKLESYAENYNDAGTPQYADYTGDDCNSFAMGVMRLLTKGYRGQSGNIPERDLLPGIDLQKTGPSTMMSDKSFETKMFNMGYQKYYLGKNEEGKQAWMHKYLENGIVKETEVAEMNVKFLQPGDMLVCKEHVEFFSGFGYEYTFNNMKSDKFLDRKKSGIQSFERNNKPLREGYNNNGKFVGEGKRYGTFGWGNVKDIYPAQAVGDGEEKNTNYYFTYDSKKMIFKWFYSSKSDSQLEYKTIWR